MPPPAKHSVEQKLFRHSRNVLAVIVLTYIPFTMIAFIVDILVSFTKQLVINDLTEAFQDLFFNFEHFIGVWIWFKLGQVNAHIAIPIVWGLCCLYHRKLVFDLPRKTFWAFVFGLTVFWFYYPMRGHYASLQRDDYDFDPIRYVYVIVSILTVLGCWWLVERRRAKILPES
ncbi:MAG: hypothetical protein ACON4J_04680 [Parvibaculales bacterium]